MFVLFVVFDSQSVDYKAVNICQFFDLFDKIGLKLNQSLLDMTNRFGSGFAGPVTSLCVNPYHKWYIRITFTQFVLQFSDEFE